jgi:hypothetical protein
MTVKALRGVCIGVNTNMMPNDQATIDGATAQFLSQIGAVTILTRPPPPSMLAAEPAQSSPPPIAVQQHALTDEPENGEDSRKSEHAEQSAHHKRKGR